MLNQTVINGCKFVDVRTKHISVTVRPQKKNIKEF